MEPGWLSFSHNRANFSQIQQSRLDRCNPAERMLPFSWRMRKIPVIPVTRDSNVIPIREPNAQFIVVEGIAILLKDGSRSSVGKGLFTGGL